MPSQTERILNLLRYYRPFARGASQIFAELNGEIPKVSVNRALNELKARGLVMKKAVQIDGPNGRKEYVWRATYKE